MGTLYYLCDSSVVLKLFQNEKFFILIGLGILQQLCEYHLPLFSYGNKELYCLKSGVCENT